MISFSFSIRNPWSDRFKVIKSYVFTTPIKYKFIEVEAFKDSFIISLDLRLTARQSHSGFEFDIGLIGHSIRFSFYDSRHWDHEKNQWAEYIKESA